MENKKQEAQQQKAEKVEKVEKTETKNQTVKPKSKTTVVEKSKPTPKKENENAVKPVEQAKEKTENKPLGKSIEEVVKQLKAVEKEVKAEEKKAEETKEKENTFVPDCKEKRPKDFASMVEIAARYNDDQAKNMLRKKIAQSKEVHIRFLQKIEDPSAFKIEKLFVPVYCGKADVRYSWKTKVNKVETQHEDVCAKENRFSNANKDLDVGNFLMENLVKTEEKESTKILKDSQSTFKKTFGQFNRYLKESAPSTHVTIEKRDEEYTLVYVPVMKATCTLDGEQYVGYVNLHNGACYSSYKVSDIVANAAEKSALAAKMAKRNLISTFIFSLTFSLLTLFSALKLVDWDFGALPTKTVWVTFVLAVLSLPSLALAIGINAVKKETLIDKAIRLNQTPGVAWSRFVSIVGALCAICSVILFFFLVMV